MKHPKNIRFLLSCLILLSCLFIHNPDSSVQATSTATSNTSLTKINSIISENEKEINELTATQTILRAECMDAINNCLEQNLLVNERDLQSLEKLSSNLEKRTEKLKTAKEQQSEVETSLEEISNTKGQKYRKLKCKIITLQNRQFKLISQLNKDMKKIIKLCTPKETD